MKKLWVFIKASLVNSMIERGDMFLYSISIFITPVVIMFIWLVINKEGSNTILNYDQLVIYYLASILIKTINSAWMGQYIPGRIRRGEISAQLLKPMPFTLEWVGNNLAEKVMKLIFLVPMVLILGKLLVVSFPALSLMEWALVGITTIFGSIIYFLLDIIVGFLAFWLEETNSIQELFLLLMTFFSGGLIPLLALPLFWRQVASVLPFRYILSLPLEIISRQLSSSEILTAILVQALYLVGACFLYKFVFKNGTKIYSASGA